MTIQESDLEKVAIDCIDRCPYQPRRIFDQEEIKQLSDSIKEVGLIQPIVVRKREGGRFELIAGERRWRACQQAGLSIVPVVIRNDSDSVAASAALVENIQRVDLNAIEVAQALEKLAELYSLNQEQLAIKVGKKRSTVANYLRLLTLPENVQTGLQSGKITMGHAKVILSLETPSKREALYTKIMCRGLSVRETETAAVQISEHVPLKQRLMPFGQNEHIKALEQALQQKLGTKVKVSGNTQGRVTIEYHNLDDLDRLLERLDVQI